MELPPGDRATGRLEFLQRDRKVAAEQQRQHSTRQQRRQRRANQNEAEPAQRAIHVCQGCAELDHTDEAGCGGKRPQRHVRDEFTAALDTVDVCRQAVSAEDPPDGVIPNGCRVQVLRQNLARGHHPAVGVQHHRCDVVPGQVQRQIAAQRGKRQPHPGEAIHVDVGRRGEVFSQRLGAVIQQELIEFPLVCDAQNQVQQADRGQNDDGNLPPESHGTRSV